MATVMEFTSPVGQFPLGSVFENLPDARVELERLIPHDTLVIPYFWVRGGDPTDIEAAFGDHEGVHTVRLVDSVDSEYLMRAEWDWDYAGLLNAFSATNLVVLSGVGTTDGWEFEVRGDSRDDISDFRAHCQEHEIQIDITAVHALIPIHSATYSLTDAQQEALVLAYEHGYFDSPRRCTLTDIADELDITQQSLSSRLRRGHRRLIGATLIHD